MQRMTTPPLFHQTEDPVYLQPGFYKEVTGGYDSSNVLGRDFLQPHVIPDLPNYEPLFDTCEVTNSEPAQLPNSPSGAMYAVPSLPRSLQAFIIACGMFPPSYENGFDQGHPEWSSHKQVAEMQVLVREAKAQYKEAWRELDLCMAEEEMETSRWERIHPISVLGSPAVQTRVPEQPSAGGAISKKQMGPAQGFGGNIMEFDQWRA